MNSKQPYEHKWRRKKERKKFDTDMNPANKAQLKYPLQPHKPRLCFLTILILSVLCYKNDYFPSSKMKKKYKSSMKKNKLTASKSRHVQDSRNVLLKKVSYESIKNSHTIGIHIFNIERVLILKTAQYSSASEF